MRGQERCRYDEFLPALASETRQAILELLVSREMTVTGLTEEMGLSQPTVSHHLAILRRAGLGSVDIWDLVILSEVRAKNLCTV